MPEIIRTISTSRRPSWHAVLEPRPDKLALRGGEIGLARLLVEEHLPSLSRCRCHGLPDDALRMRGSRTDKSRSVKKFSEHNRRRQQEDDGAGQLLVVGARQRLDQQCASVGQRQDQRHDRQLVEHPVQIETKAVDDRPQRVPCRIAPQKLRPETPRADAAVT